MSYYFCLTIRENRAREALIDFDLMAFVVFAIVAAVAAAAIAIVNIPIV